MVDDPALHCKVVQIHQAIDIFAAAMKTKVESDIQKGQHSWDDPISTGYNPTFLLNHMRQGFGTEVDIANQVMMMFWHRNLHFQIALQQRENHILLEQLLQIRNEAP